MFFKTRVAAESELERLKIVQRQQGQAGLNLSETVRGLAAECSGLLARYPGQTILDATRFYVAHLDSISSSIPVEKLCADYLQSKRRAQLSELHLNDVEYRLARFERAFVGRGVRTLTLILSLWSSSPATSGSRKQLGLLRSFGKSTLA